MHQALRSIAATSSYARRSTATSAGVGPWPVTCATKSAATSSGSCAAVIDRGPGGRRPAPRPGAGPTSACGNRCFTRRYRSSRAVRVGDGDPHPGVDVRLARRTEQVLERARHVGEPARHRRGDQRRCAPVRRTGRPAPSTWRGAARRTSTPAASRCSAASVPVGAGDALRAVQVAERDVVGAREHPGRHLVDAADPDVPLGLRRRAADDERVRGHDRPRPGRPATVRRRPPGCGASRPRPPPRASGPAAPGRRPARRARSRGRGTGCRRPARRPRRRRAPPAPPGPATRVRSRTRSRMSAEPKPSRVAESWLPDVTTTVVCSASRASVSDSSVTASTGGIARSYTSPATTTASTCSARTTSTRCSRYAAWWSSRSTPCSVRPRCQSDVCNNRMRANVNQPTDTPADRSRGGVGQTSRDPGELARQPDHLEHVPQHAVRVRSVTGMPASDAARCSCRTNAMPDESMNVACVESTTTGWPVTSARPMQALASSRSAASISPTRTIDGAVLLGVDPDGPGRGRVLDQVHCSSVLAPGRRGAAFRRDDATRPRGTRHPRCENGHRRPRVPGAGPG